MAPIAHHGASVWLAVAAGGALGALARFGVTTLALRLLGSGFPWGVLGANVIGSFLMGVLICWLETRMIAEGPVWAFLGVGVLGAFTTFSTFALDAATLWRTGDLAPAVVYVLGSVILSIGALAFGIAAARAVL